MEALPEMHIRTALLPPLDGRPYELTLYIDDSMESFATREILFSQRSNSGGLEEGGILVN